MHPDLYLIRHGETEWNRQQRLQGRSDSPLTRAGLAQAQGLRSLARSIQAAPVSSPQGRARHSARLIFGTEVPADPRLVEIDTGLFTGQCLPDLRAAHPALFAGPGLSWYDNCPGGEGLAALSLRCRDFLAGLAAPAAVVSHGITLRMIWALATGAGSARIAEAPIHQGRILVIRKGSSQLLTAPPGLASADE